MYPDFSSLQDATHRRAPAPRATAPPPSQDDGAKPESDHIATSAAATDHAYLLSSPQTMKRKLDVATDTLSSVRRKLKSSEQKNRRLESKVETLQSVIDSLEERRIVSDSCAEQLSDCITGVPLDIMSRMIQNTKSGTYSDNIKSFAMTLQFYSSKAYTYVRETFGLNLPHPSTIRRWYNVVDGQPGFTAEAFAALKLKGTEAKTRGEELLCSLMLDEISTRKHVEWVGDRALGYVDIGTGVVDGASQVASEALVFMAVCVHSNWKVPVGYFFVKGLNAEEKANLVTQCVSKLEDVGVTVVSLTCDGPTCHTAMLKRLGATIDPNNMRPEFAHPTKDGGVIRAFLDACHMIKLVRNFWAASGVLIDGEKKTIRWDLINRLNALQQQEGLVLANKLRSGHVTFRNQVMKVNVAVQTISSSVADAIEFCTTKLQLPEFQDSGPTCTFLRTFDRLFDVLNSRNPLARGFKGPLRVSTAHVWMPFLDTAEVYIRSLKTATGQPVTQGRNKTPFIGFLMGITGVKALVSRWVDQPGSPLSYLLTYKLSQDHLELLFCAIRASLGSNNNPTCRQFIASYKRLIMRTQVKSDAGNCTAQDHTSILSTVSHVRQSQFDDVHIARQYNLETPDTEEDHLDVPMMSSSAEYRDAVVGYIAGYVVKMVERRIHCPECVPALRGELLEGTSAQQALVAFKDRGGLVKASSSVISTCSAAEQCVRRVLVTTNGQPPRDPRVIQAITTTVLERIGRTAFPVLASHVMDLEMANNHIYTLVRCIVHCYCRVRFHHVARSVSDKLAEERLRKKLNKLVLFKGM